MDLLIIRKDKGVAITNQIGDIFRTHNIWEYKSPDDDITIDDYFKTVGYAYLYKGLGKTVNEISGDELTVSMARDVHPDKLFSVITQSGGKIEQKYQGIYHISGVVNIPTQVIVTCELDKVLYTSLRILTKRAWMKTWSVFCGWPGRLKNRWTGRIQMDPAVECCVSSY